MHQPTNFLGVECPDLAVDVLAPEETGGDHEQRFPAGLRVVPHRHAVLYFGTGPAAPLFGSFLILSRNHPPPAINIYTTL